MTTLAGALPELRAAYDALDQYARSIGISIALADYGGVRTEADTTQILQFRDADYAVALRAGVIRPDTTLRQFRPINAFGTSWHNYGAAFDVRIIARPSSMTDGQALAKLGAAAGRFGLRWGGTFTTPDTPHFELAIPLADAKARYDAMTGTASGGGLSFDLSSFLPGFAPSDEGDGDPLELSYNDTVESGGDFGGEQSPVPLLVLGLAVAGVVAWALRRKFF